jgi:hypothetical protein
MLNTFKACLELHYTLGHQCPPLAQLYARPINIVITTACSESFSNGLAHSLRHTKQANRTPAAVGVPRLCICNELLQKSKAESSAEATRGGECSGTPDYLFQSVSIAGPTGRMSTSSISHQLSRSTWPQEMANIRDSTCMKVCMLALWLPNICVPQKPIDQSCPSNLIYHNLPHSPYPWIQCPACKTDLQYYFQWIQYGTQTWNALMSKYC